MLIDHVNNALITPFLNGKGFLLHLSNLFSILGRIAFPIFVFFIVEGFFKTSNRKKYLITLLLFGVISEVPFDMFTSKVFFDPYWNNIMFTLALCLITIWIIDAVKAKISNKVLWYSISIVVVGISCAVAMALSLDYDYHAIIVAYIFYIFQVIIPRNIRFKQTQHFICAKLYDVEISMNKIFSLLQGKA